MEEKEASKLPVHSSNITILLLCKIARINTKIYFSPKDKLLPNS
jgi:hypothetical protein